MLPKKIRLTTAPFNQVFKTGKVQHGNFFWVRSSLSPTELSSRFAVAVSKKVAPTAVLRNKTKRIVYRAIETLYKEISDNHENVVVIFGVKKDISKIPFTEIVQELKNLLNFSR